MDTDNQLPLDGFEPNELIAHNEADDPAGEPQRGDHADDTFGTIVGHTIADTGISTDSGEVPNEEGGDSAVETVEKDRSTDRRVMAMATPDWRYPISRLVFDFRQMTDDEFLALEHDVKENGLICPITRWRSEIIDGMHRLLACLASGIEPRFEDLDDDADPESHIKSKNDVRRHLSVGEKAEAAARRSARSQKGRHWPSATSDDYSANLRNKEFLTQTEAANLYNISERSVSHGVRVFSPDSPAIPQLQQAVREGKIAVSDASQVVQEPTEIQRTAVDLVGSGKAGTVAEGVRKAHFESAGRRPEYTEVASLAYEKNGISIHQVGVADLTKYARQASVDVIIYSPNKDSGDSALALAAILGSHALSKEGLLVVEADPGRLQPQLARVTQRKLEWICQVHLVFESPISDTGEPHYLKLRSAPLLLFGKPGARLDGGDDVIAIPPQPEGSKNDPQSIRHAAELVIGRFVKPGQVVCIPELSGGGISLLIAAARAGCKVIAADSEQSRIRRVVKELSKLKAGQFSDDHDGA